MKNSIQSKGALLLFLLTLLLSLCTAPALRAQVLFEEDFDDFAIGVLPPNWPIQGVGNVFSARACGGNAYEMNAFNGNPLPGFGTPKIDRGNAPGNVVLTFDYRIEDWNDASQLTGTGRWAVFLNQTQLFAESIAFTDGCATRTLTFTSFDIGLGTEFDFQFVADWTSGDWGLSIDNISVTLLNDGCRQAVELTQTDVRPGVLTTPTDGTFVGATPSGLPSCTGTANDDVWYKFTATERSVGVSVAGGDVVVQLYEGGCGALNTLVCRDALTTNEIISYHGTTPGEEYHVRVYTFDDAPLDPAESTFRIQIGTPQAVNDECVSATPVQQSANRVCSSSEVTGSLERATDSGLAACTGTANDDVWYEFQATDPEVAFSITGGDVVVELFSGECGNLNSLNCVDEFFSGEEFSIDNAIVGETYYLRIHSFGDAALTGSAAEFTLCVFTPCPLDPPSNLSVSNVTATTAELSYSYEFLEPRTEVVVLRGASPFGSAVYERSSVACCFPATGLSPGTDYDYYVLTDCTGSIATGPVPFSTKQLGDECVDAFPLTQSSATTCGTSFTQGTVEGATSSLAGCTGTANDDVWYEFVATSTDISVYLESGDFVVQLFSGGCGNLTSLVCRDLFFDNETFDFAGATVGETYFLRVYSSGNTPLTGADAEFGICVFTTPAVPANDACANAVNLPVNPSRACVSPTPGTTNGADRTEPDPLCSGINGLASVWYSFTATSTSHLITLSNVDILNGNDGDRASFEVFSGGCGARTRVQCSGQLFGTNPDPVTVSGLTAGQEYLIRVVPVNPQDAIDFDICVTTDCPALATGLEVTDVTATTALLGIAETDGEERDFIVVAAGDVPVFGDGSNHVSFISSTANQVTASGLSSNTAYDFYVGQGCSPSFSGPVTFTTRPSCGDVIYDTGGPSGNYGDNEDYTVTICPETADQSGGPRRVAITFDEFEMENAFDGITIYDGEDTNAPIITSPGSGTDLWSWSEGVGSGDLTGVTVFTLNSSGCITLRITSDGSLTWSGFKATISCDLTADIFNTILTTVPAGSGAVTADRGYLSTASGYMYYVKEGVGSLLALQLGNTQAQVPLDGVSLVAGSGASNLGQNGCFAPYVTVPDWWVMNRTWDVAASIPPASPVGVRFFYTQEDFDAIATNSGFAGLTHEQLSYYKINGGDEEDLTAPGNACHDLVDPANYEEFDPGEYVYSDLTGVGGGSTAHQAEFSITSFSGGGGGAGTNFGGALPIELLSFTGEVLEKTNLLQWTSVREENTDVHFVERSTDGQAWEVLGSLAAAGNSTTEVNYEFLDRAPLASALYRIRTVDLDGSRSLSPLVALTREDTSTALRLGKPFPSPTDGPFTLPIAAPANVGNVDVRIFDATGREVQRHRPSFSTGWNSLSLDLTNSPAGLYYVQVADLNGATLTQKVIKR